MQKLYNRTTNFVGYSVQIGQFSSNSIDIVLKGFMTRLGISTNNIIKPPLSSPLCFYKITTNMNKIVLIYTTKIVFPPLLS